MIDTKELRRLAQAATPGPWKTGQYLGSLRQFVIHVDVGDKGRGSDVAFTSAAFGNDETVANARLIAAANPAAISELLDRLEAAEKERDAMRARIEAMEKQEPVKHEFQGRDGVWYPFIDQRHHENTVAAGSWPVRALYALPGAKGE